MRQPPPLAQLPRYPVVGGVGLLAVAVSLAYWSKKVDVSPLMEDHEIRQGQVWRLVTSTLPHGDPLHLAFNLLWLWVLGTLIEEVFGHVRTFLLILLLAAGSGAADYAFSHGGIGLSGVGYGLFGFLWVLSRRDDRFRGAVDAQTVQLFVGWFFLCIVLTAANVWHVANVAHGVGALMGVLVGMAVAGGKLRSLYGAVTMLLLAGFGAAVYARPYVNLTVERAEERAQLGYDAAKNRDYDAAVRH
jgi:GlpG protein